MITEGSGSGSVPRTNGSGSGSRRPKNIRIRISANLDAGDARRDLAEEDPVPVKLETAELESLQGTPHQRLHRLKQKGPAGQENACSDGTDMKKQPARWVGS